MHCFCIPVCIVFFCNCRFKLCNCRFRRFGGLFRFSSLLVAFARCRGSFLGNFGGLEDHGVGLVIPKTVRALLEKFPEDKRHGLVLIRGECSAHSLEPLLVKGKRLACRIVVIEQAPIT